MTRAAAVLLAVACLPAWLLADDHVVQADRTVNFSAIKTFMFRERTITTDRPELNNAIVLAKVTDTIRAALKARGLTETTDRPDVMVAFTVSGQDYSVGPFGRASQIDGGRGGRSGRAGRGQGQSGDQQSSQPVAFTEGMLVLDLHARDSGLLIWRGVYRDSEKDSAKLAQKLPDDAGKLLSEFPPKKR
jgi:hypothetical protein